MEPIIGVEAVSITQIVEQILSNLLPAHLRPNIAIQPLSGGNFNDIKIGVELLSYNFPHNNSCNSVSEDIITDIDSVRPHMRKCSLYVCMLIRS